jgi:hypothetical protein
MARNRNQPRRPAGRVRRTSRRGRTVYIDTRGTEFSADELQAAITFFAISVDGFDGSSGSGSDTSSGGNDYSGGSDYSGGGGYSGGGDSGGGGYSSGGDGGGGGGGF